MRLIKIDSLDSEELNIYSKLNESQLLHYFEPKPGLFIAESPIVIERALEAGHNPISAILDEKELEKIPDSLKKYCEANDIPVYISNEEVLKEITGFKLTRGMLSAMRRRSGTDLSLLLERSKRIAVLEEIVNPTNIGAIFRSAAALNMDAVLLTGGCSDPLYRRAIRVSMGTVFKIPWTYIGNSYDDWKNNGISLLKNSGFVCAAMALDDDSVSISDKRLLDSEKIAIILGTEGQGLSDDTIRNCDYTVKIPMSHGVDSLNVAAASAVAFYQITADK